MTREEELAVLRREQSRLEEELADNRKSYHLLSEQEDFFSGLARDTTRFYEDLLTRYRGTDFSTGLSRDWEGVQQEQEHHHKHLRERLLDLEVARKVLLEKEQAGKELLTRLERREVDEC